MNKDGLSDWFYFKGFIDKDIDEYKKNFFSELVCYRFLKEEKSFLCIAVIHWIPQTKVFFGVLFEEKQPAKCLYSLEGGTLETVRLKIDLKLKEIGYNISIF